MKIKEFYNKIICDDCRNVLKNIPDNSVHMILSDIPYGISLDKWDVLHDNTNSALLGSSPAQLNAGNVFKRRGKPINGWSNADKEIPKQYQEWCSSWAEDTLRVLKPGGSAIIFAGRRFAARCIVALEDTGFNFRDMIAWERSQAVHRAQRVKIVFERRGDNENAEKWNNWRLGNLKPNFEPILWFFKPYKITVTDNLVENELGAYNEKAVKEWFSNPNNIFKCDYNINDRGLHEAQKPIKLFSGLIEMLTLKGHIILDPFAGSGTTGLAAKILDRKYILIEKDKKSFEIIKKRMKEAVQRRLFE
ncbi:site-specific DNA-methyltransferase [Candidatus Dependentiae bacterium]|nr:site-specific DNA-methyltransferase [Candidatus Dependentiae bacterium]